MITLSVIVPARNAEHTIRKCLASVETSDTVELIVVNDGSTDGTAACLEDALAGRPNTFFCHTAISEGAGPARNTGVGFAKGEWIVFLDADDELSPMGISLLEARAAAMPEDVDIMGYNPRDAKWMQGSKDNLLNAYLSMRTDGSVIYTAIRASLAKRLSFPRGLHEDLPYMAAAYLACRQTAYIGGDIYRKGPAGVTGTYTEQHTLDFIAAWRSVLQQYADAGRPFGEPAAKGLIAAVATRVRAIYQLVPLERQRALLDHLRDALPSHWLAIIKRTALATETTYSAIAKRFVDGENWWPPEDFDYSWSCKDLQDSAYLGPSEVRACCKRFFVDGERKGDVVLLGEGGVIHPHAILAEKLSLLDAINAGDKTSCTGCPWLEFKPWGRKPELKVSYLSMEHHSVCNLKCTYCSPTYYDGRRPTYDVAMIAKELLEPGGTVVWGGGEPTLSPEFSLLEAFSREGAKQRVLSNAVKLNSTLAGVLRTDKNAELITSVDAGTPLIYEMLRGKDKMREVLQNLQVYMLAAPRRVTVKYIMTDLNQSESEIEAFVLAMCMYGLTRCNFQISCDFRNKVALVEEVAAVASLHSKLLIAGAQCVFVDDLARIRISPAAKDIDDARQFEGANPADYPKGVLIRGLGEQCTRLLRDTYFFTRTVAAGIVAAEDYLPADLPALPIVIAASQSYPRLYWELVDRGLSDRIIRQLVL